MSSPEIVEAIPKFSQVRHKTFGWRGVVEHSTPLYMLITFEDGGQQWCLKDSLEVTLAPQKWNPLERLLI